YVLFDFPDFLKDPVTKQRLSGALDGGRRRFLNAGVGGFSDRYPISCAETSFEPERGTAPIIFGLSNQACPGRLPQRFTKQQICFSKQNRLSQERRQYVEAVEHRLKTHPLALYPYLESGMTPELFDDVLSVLDPEIHVKRERSVTSSKKQEKRIEENVAPCEVSFRINKPLTPIMSPITKKEVKCFSSRNPYKWKDVKETHANEKQLASVKDLYSPSQDEDLKKVTKLFCDWASSLVSLCICSEHIVLKTERERECLIFPSGQDEELKQIHGAQAFKQFIITKGLRMPRVRSPQVLELAFGV
uniref:Uncharacterized protein n=1 Tax=Electrophorus electricus TaxID=8005 RepID=A0A4W4HCB2_ELEEL